MKKITLPLTTVTLVLYSTMACLAHEGHGHESPLSPGHYVTNPEHALPLALTLVVALTFGWLLYRKAFRTKGK